MPAASSNVNVTLVCDDPFLMHACVCNLDVQVRLPKVEPAPDEVYPSKEFSQVRRWHKLLVPTSGNAGGRLASFAVL